MDKGQIETAKTYFYNAKGYSDADTRIQRYYYEAGEALLKSTDYLAAAEKFILAGNYLDSTGKVKECYYNYGKQQMQLNYVSEGVKYLSLCRGYRDADDILLSYYYDEAKKIYSQYSSAYTTGDNYTINTTYKEIIPALELCENYKDSVALKTAVEFTYQFKSVMYGNVSSHIKTMLEGSSFSVDGNILNINVPNFQNYVGVICSLNLNYDMSSKTFNATISNMYFDESVVAFQ